MSEQPKTTEGTDDYEAMRMTRSAPNFSMKMIAVGIIYSTAISLLLLILSHWFFLFAYCNFVVLCFMLYLLIFSIPVTLNWSYNMYGNVFWAIIRYSLFAIFIYAGHYYWSGLKLKDGGNVHLFDYLYFSITMWACLGYNEFTPPPHMRLLSALEALNGLITLPVLAAVIWQYCSFKIRPLKQTVAAQDLPDMLYLNIQEGAFVDKNNIEEARKAEQDRASTYALNPCLKCGNSSLVMPRYWEVMNWFSPFPVFVVKCCQCGNVSDPKRTAYRAARVWNKSNPPVAVEKLRL